MCELGGRGGGTATDGLIQYPIDGAAKRYSQDFGNSQVNINWRRPLERGFPCAGAGKGT